MAKSSNLLKYLYVYFVLSYIKQGIAIVSRNITLFLFFRDIRAGFFCFH